MGLDFQAIAPRVDEDTLKGSYSSPKQLAQFLATKKAQSLVEDFPNSILLGGDQVVALGSEIFDKPKTFDRAVEQLKTLSGHTHQLFTAMTLIYKGQVWEHVDRTDLSMRPLPLDTLLSYVRYDHPVNCAGAYKIESGGVALFHSIQTQDPSSVEGIPLLRLVDILLDLGYPLNFRVRL